MKLPFAKKALPDPLDRAEASSPVPEESTSPETTSVQPEGKHRIPITHRTFAKAAAFLLCILSVFAAFFSVWGGLIMLEEELYTTPQEVYLQDRYRYSDLSYSLSIAVQSYVVEGQEEEAQQYLSHRNVARLELLDPEDDTVLWSYESDTLPADGPSYTLLIDHAAAVYQAFSPATPTPDASPAPSTLSGQSTIVHDSTSVLITSAAPYTTRITLPAVPVYQDDYLFLYKLVDLAYDLLYAIWGIALFAVLLAVACFVFLLCAAGHRNGLPDVTPGWGTAVPLDALTAGVGFGGVCLIALADELSWGYDAKLIYTAVFSTAVLLLAVLLGWCMSFALRVKLGGWWKNTIIYRLLLLCLRIWKWLWRSIRALGGLLATIPLVWKTAIYLLCACILESILLALNLWEPDNLVLLFCAKWLLLLPTVLYLALCLKKLQKGGKALAEGDLSHQVDTRRMPPDLKRHGEDLNSLGAGMTIAVEQRLRSERMKTELITNVSHDIKTPLTSIINYADLIGKEPTDNQTIQEYAAVLLRQSERLKRLIDDLVEASKASTGSLEVILAPCEAGVMLTQAAGEFAERLTAAHLTLVTTQPEHPVRILADGRRLWRVFDNLMGNICKYAQPGTRVYLTLEEQEGQAVISFKNTSRDALNLPADELMERFIRGDTSRNTEGNGLGLSIAKSLTDLQKGSFELSVDGDLFKVILKFPVIP